MLTLSLPKPVFLMNFLNLSGRNLNILEDKKRNLSCLYRKKITNIIAKKNNGIEKNMFLSINFLLNIKIITKINNCQVVEIIFSKDIITTLLLKGMPSFNLPAIGVPKKELAFENISTLRKKESETITKELK